MDDDFSGCLGHSAIARNYDCVSLSRALGIRTLLLSSLLREVHRALLSSYCPNRIF